MKKLVSMVLAFTLCAGMLAGCSGSKSNTASSSEPSEDSKSSVIKVGVSSDITSLCISSSVFPKNRKEKFPTLGMGYSHISAGNIFI